MPRERPKKCQKDKKKKRKFILSQIWRPEIYTPPVLEVRNLYSPCSGGPKNQGIGWAALLPKALGEDPPLPIPVTIIPFINVLLILEPKVDLSLREQF